MTDSPVYQLPEPLALDARSAVALAVNTALDTQLAGQGAAVVIDPGPVADDVLAALGEGDHFPRIPQWTGDLRTVGGGRLAGEEFPQPAVTVDVEPDDRGGWRTGYIAFTVQAAHGDDTVEGRAVVPVEDAEQWFLAGLAACRAARE